MNFLCSCRNAFLVCLVMFLSGCVGSLSIVSVSSNGTPGDGPSYNAAISANGNFVAFVSEATNFLDPGLIPGDGSVGRNVYVRHLKGANTELVSLAENGLTIDTQVVGTPDISADGRFVVWASDSPYLVAGDTNNRTDIFLRDRQLIRTIRISLGTIFDNGARTVESNGNSINPAISPDGLMIVFESDATNLIEGDTNGTVDVFVRFFLTSGITNATDPSGIGITDRVSRIFVNNTSIELGQVNGNSNEPDIGNTDFDGLLANIAFQSDTNVSTVSTDVNGFTDVFSKQAGTLIYFLESFSSPNPSDGPSTHPSIGAEGLYLAFASDATNVTVNEAPDTNGVRDIIIRGLQPISEFAFITTRSRASVSLTGIEANGPSDNPAMSWEGQFVAFETDATNLHENWTDPSVFTDIYLRNHENGKIMMVSRGDIVTPGNGHSRRPSVSNHGHRVAFDSVADNLIASDTNGVSDVFVYARFRGTCFWWHPFDFPFCVRGELE